MLSPVQQLSLCALFQEKNTALCLGDSATVRLLWLWSTSLSVYVAHGIHGTSEAADIGSQADMAYRTPESCFNEV